MLSFHEQKKRGTDAFPLQIFPCRRFKEGDCTALPHYHREIEIMQPLEGITQLSLNGELINAQPGQIFFINPGDVHAMYSKVTPMRYRCFVFPRELLALPANSQTMTQLIDPLFNGQLRFPLCRTDPTLQMLLDEIAALYQQEGGETFILAALLRFLAILEKEGTLTPAEPSPKISDPVRLAITFMEDHHAEHITLPQIAEVAGLSTHYFCNYFKKQTGFSPITYLTNVRIRRAKELLKRSDLSVLNVALSCGFEDVSFFIKKFKFATDQTPLQYRKNATKKSPQ